MVILIDTNIIIDALADREPYATDAKQIMEKCATREITGVLAAHSIPNLFYILRKEFSQEECAVASMADYIVTRNPSDFKHSRIKVILPNEFLRKMQENKKE